MSKVLVTGSAGRIGRSVVRELANAHTVRGFDILPNPDLDDQIVADIADRDAVRRACRDIDAVVHLAAYPDEADFHEKLLRPNVIGAVNIFQAAHENRVRRVVLASSGQVLFGYGFDCLWTADMHPKPRNLYGAAKAFAEMVGEVYAAEHGMSVIVVRLGWVPRDQPHLDELAASKWGQQSYLSPRDAGRFFRAAVEADNIDYVILYATSNPPDFAVKDIEPARKLIGYEPQDTYPEGTDLSI